MEMRAAVGGKTDSPINTSNLHAHEYLEAKQQQLRGGQFEVEIRVQEGPVVQGIIDAAETENADLIAIASHGRTGLSRIFYGSVTSGILNRIDRPLLIIRSDEG
jgi:nucleotide-binding universal stress UspA family protein